MRLTTFKKNETNLSMLVERFYPHLDVVSRKKAEIALVKANPHLSEFAEFRPGIVVALPTIPGITPKPAGEKDDPVDEVQSQLTTAVKSYQKSTAQRMSETLKEIDTQRKMLHDDSVMKVIQSNGQGAEALAKRLDETLEARLQMIEKEQATQKEFFSKILKDLQGLSGW